MNEYQIKIRTVLIGPCQMSMIISWSLKVWDVIRGKVIENFYKRNYKKNEKFRVKISGYFVRVNIIKIETN